MADRGPLSGEIREQQEELYLLFLVALGLAAEAVQHIRDFRGQRFPLSRVASGGGSTKPVPQSHGECVGATGVQIGLGASLHSQLMLSGIEGDDAYSS